MGIEQVENAWNEVVIFVAKMRIVANDKRVLILEEDGADRMDDPIVIHHSAREAPPSQVSLCGPACDEIFRRSRNAFTYFWHQHSFLLDPGEMVLQFLYSTMVLKQMNNARNIAIIFIRWTITVDDKRIPILEQDGSDRMDDPVVIHHSARELPYRLIVESKSQGAILKTPPGEPLNLHRDGSKNLSAHRHSIGLRA
jgi:hypothetical protein